MKLLRHAALLGIGVAAVAPAAASEGGGGLGQALITPQFGTFFWTLLTFVLMVAVLGRYAWKPLLGALDAREQGIRDSLEQARRERDEAQKLVQQQRELVVEARRERAAALEQGRADADKLRTEMLAEAERSRAEVLRQTDVQVQTALRQARSEFRGLAVDLSLRAAEKLLSRNLDAPTQRKLVEDYLEGLEKSGPCTNSN